MNWFKVRFGERPIASVTPDDLRDYLEKPKNQPTSRRKPPAVISLKTWNNRRGMLNTFCRYCLEKGYLAENPINQVPKYKQSARRSTAVTECPPFFAFTFDMAEHWKPLRPNYPT